MFKLPNILRIEVNIKVRHDCDNEASNCHQRHSEPVEASACIWVSHVFNKVKILPNVKNSWQHRIGP